MIAEQLRREQPVRLLAAYLPLSVLLGSLIWGMVRITSAQLGPIPWVDHTPGVYQSLVLIWSVLWGFLLNAGVNNRCSEFDLGLPLSGRMIWLVHNASVILSAWAILAVMAATVAAGNWLEGREPLLKPGLVSLGIGLGVSLFLTMAVLQSPKPQLHLIPVRMGYIIRLVLSIGGFLALTIVLSRLPRAYAWLPFALAFVLYFRIYLKLPRSFAVVPREPEIVHSPERVSGRSVDISGEPGRATGRLHQAWLLNSTIWRSFMGNWTWALLPILGFHGFFLSSSTYSTYSAFFFLILLVSASWTMGFLGGIFRFDPLPISRRRIFAVFAIPTLLTIALGYGLGAIGSFQTGRPSELLDYRPSRSQCCYYICLPEEYWKIAWDGVVPEQTSPWGESSSPQGVSLAANGQVKVYMPYEIPLEASPDFAALQLSRAIEAIYGRKVPYREIRERYLGTDDQGHVSLKDSGFTLYTDYPDLKTRPRGRFFLVMLLIGFPWLLFVSVVCRVARANFDVTVGRVLIISIFVCIGTVGVGLLAAQAVGFVDLAAVNKWVAILLWQLEESIPGGIIAVGAGSLLLLLAGYALALSQFVRTEAPLNPQNTG